MGVNEYQTIIVPNLLAEEATKRRTPKMFAAIPAHDYKQFLSTIIQAYDSLLIRTYCQVRFTIININILHMLTLCLRGRRRVLDIGCGFGLFGCYFAAMNPELEYQGLDLDAKRIGTANRAAERLGLKNASFRCADARDLTLEDEFDAIMMLDLMHHIDDDSKQELIQTCANHLAPDGRLIIKDVTAHPFPKMAFTWVLDVLMTRGFEMWYWNEERFQALLNEHFECLDTFPITDLLPYPHIIYLSENVLRSQQASSHP